MNIMFIPIKDISERVPNKNFRDFNERPLWLHAIHRFNKDFKIYIDTDSETLIENINQLETTYGTPIRNVKIYERPEKLRGHFVPVTALIENFIQNELEETETRYITQAHVTNPFLQASTIKNALAQATRLYHDSVVSVTKIQERGWRKNNKQLIPINHNPTELKPTQELDPIYFENSAFYIFGVSRFLEMKTRIGEDPYFYELSFPESLDIDTEEDFKLCQKVAQLEQLDN